MSKTFLVLIAGAVAALILGGVLEVTVHPDRISGVPAKVIGAAKDAGTIEGARVAGVGLKRKVEQWFIKDEHQKFEVALLYVEKDAKRLQELIEGEGTWDPAKVLPQAGLLASSVARVHEQSETVSVDVLTDLQGKTGEALTGAKNMFLALKGFQTDYEELKEKLASTLESLEIELGKFNLVAEQDNDEKTGEVAGTQTEPEPKPGATPEPTSTIPLQF